MPPAIEILSEIYRETPGMLAQDPAVTVIIPGSSIDDAQFAASEIANDPHDLARLIQLIHGYVFGYAGLLFRTEVLCQERPHIRRQHEIRESVQFHRANILRRVQGASILLTTQANSLRSVSCINRRGLWIPCSVMMSRSQSVKYLCLQ